MSVILVSALSLKPMQRHFIIRKKNFKFYFYNFLDKEFWIARILKRHNLEVDENDKFLVEYLIFIEIFYFSNSF